VDIEFEQLVELAKKLPPTKWSSLNEEVGKMPIRRSKSKSLETFLLKAPTFSLIKLTQSPKPEKRSINGRQNSTG